MPRRIGLITLLIPRGSVQHRALLFYCPGKRFARAVRSSSRHGRPEDIQTGLET